MQFNKVIVAGNLTRDPEVRYNPSGKAVATLSLAVNNGRAKTREERKSEDVSFFDVIVWEKQAETCASYLSKGSGILVEGRLQQKRWEQDGTNRSKVEIVASNIQFMPKRQSGDGPDDGDNNDVPF